MNALAVAEPLVVSDEAGLVRRFLSWLPQASAAARADAVSALARAYLHCELTPEARGQAEIALTSVLDDPEPRVRRALAEALASARNAPRHIVLALASDHSDVSRAPLALSPLLGDADLVDCAAMGDAIAQTAIARRSHLSAPVAAALAEVGDRAAVLALIGNGQAAIGRAALWRLFERFGRDAEVRARLVDRPGLPPSLRAAIAVATTSDVADFAASAAWLDPRRAERIAREGREQAFVAIAGDGSEPELAELVHWLRVNEHLTVGLLIRALACGDTRLLRQSLTEMSGMPERRVAGLTRDARGAGFAALYAKAGMPAHFLPAFRVAAEFAGKTAGAGLGADYALTMKMLRAIEAREDQALAPIVAMLWRLASEGAREDAREFTALALAPPEVIEPEVALMELEASAPPVLLLEVEPVNENHAPAITLDLEAPDAVAA